ncbi:MAG: CxxxxCH/CxxCH domain c-type cytochrome, partial [Desulfuromonadales bacterium]
GTVTAGEISNVAAWLDSWDPAPPPVITRNGETVYNDNCSGCHKVNTYDAVGNIDLAGQGALVPTKLASGHGGTVTADEQTNLVNWLNTFQASDPYAGACDSCHGQPPSGSSSPNTAGAHAVHTSLASVANDCATCHTDAAHNDQVDLGFASTWDAKSGPAIGNSNGTCSNISCHGGVTTPNWNGGSINVDTQCSSCHTSGTSQYNGYWSGEHSKHVRSEGYACSTCHDPAKLKNGHFTDLSTRAFEQAPSATIRSSLSYSGGRCSTPSCHGSKSW